MRTNLPAKNWGLAYTVDPSDTPASASVEANSRFFEAIGQIKGLIVRTPAGGVGADDAFLQLGYAQVGIVSPQAAVFELFLVVHVAR